MEVHGAEFPKAFASTPKVRVARPDSDIRQTSFGEWFGFTWQDVHDERDAAEECDEMAIGAALHAEDGEAAAEGYRERARRHRARANRIASLLPPRQT